MREIKFRAWNKDQEIMCYDDEDRTEEYMDGILSTRIGLINSWLSTPEYEFDYRSLYEVMQYTGLKDIEQFDEPKELYTGDIVSMHQFLFDGNEVENEIIGVLDYDEEVAAVCLTKINNDYLQKYMGYENDEVGFKREKIPVCMFYGLHECSWTYLGNTHENPELLEGVTSEEESV